MRDGVSCLLCTKDACEYEWRRVTDASITPLKNKRRLSLEVCPLHRSPTLVRHILPEGRKGFCEWLRFLSDSEPSMHGCHRLATMKRSVAKTLLFAFSLRFLPQTRRPKRRGQAAISAETIFWGFFDFDRLASKLAMHLVVPSLSLMCIFLPAFWPSSAQSLVLSECEA